MSSALARALHMVRALAVAAILAFALGLPAASPASATPSVSTYDAVAYNYDATVRLSTSHASDGPARASPAGPGVASRVSHVPTGRFGDAAETGPRVFWSGGCTAQSAAERWAAANGGTTLEMTSAGRAVTSATRDMPWSEARPIWEQASADFANGASGTVHVFHNAAGVSLQSTWRNVEYPILVRNGVGMTFHTAGGGW